MLRRSPKLLATTSVKGMIFDHEKYLENIKICLDQDENLSCDSGEIHTQSSSKGEFFLDGLGGIDQLNLIAEISGNDGYRLASIL